jgi:hypothetical protein
MYHKMVRKSKLWNKWSGAMVVICIYTSFKMPFTQKMYDNCPELEKN